MKMKSVIIRVTILIFLGSCSGGRHLEVSTSAESAFREGNYEKSLEQSEQIIGDVEAKGKSAAGNVYSLAGISAYKLEEYDKSLRYLTKARQQEFSDEYMYLYLARNYRHIDNLSKEITALETYLVEYPDGKDIGKVRERLYQTCLESENFELAEELWTKMDSSSRDDVTNLEIYLNLNRKQENDSLCNAAAALILEKDSENELALSWLGEFYYRKAENSYQEQMKAYKKNRTHKQYAILLKAFKQVSADFKKSRDYYLKLYNLNPAPEYARYLGNIYTRLEDEKKADYYKKKAN